MRRNPMYVFKDITSSGIDKVPLNSIIQIESDGTRPRTIQLISKIYPNGQPFNQLTTINELLEIQEAFIDPNESLGIPSELEKIESGGGNFIKQGWKLLQEDTLKHAPIGLKSIDLTSVTNSVTGVSPYGVQGNYSFASGLNNSVEGNISAAFGEGIKSISNYSLTIGRYNLGTNINNILEIGIGTSGNRSNAFEVTNTGGVIAPNLTQDIIIQESPQVLITKEFHQNKLDTKFDKIGGIISGEVQILDGNESGNLGIQNQLKVLGKTTLNYLKLTNVDNGLSRLEFQDDTVPEDNQPTILWDAAHQNFFMKVPSRTELQPIWCSTNQGVGTGMDTDLFQGEDKSVFAMKEQVHDDLLAGLALKYDKTGGTVDGNLKLTQDLIVDGISTFNGEVNLENIVTDIHLHENVQINKDINIGRNITTNGTISIGTESSGHSSIIFTDSNNNVTEPKLFWNKDVDDFQVNTAIGSELTLWNTGTFNPGTKMEATNEDFEYINVSRILTVQEKANIPLIDNDIIVEGDIIGTKALNIDEDLFIGQNLVGQSCIYFGDSVEGNSKPRMYWEPNDKEFQIETDSQEDCTIWHSKNFNPDTKMETTNETFQKLFLMDLPDSDPGVFGQVWRDGDTLKISI